MTYHTISEEFFLVVKIHWNGKTEFFSKQWELGISHSTCSTEKDVLENNCFYEVSSKIWDKNSWKRFGAFLANLQHLKLRAFITDNLKTIIWNSHQWIINSSTKTFQICALIFQKIYCQLLLYKKHCVI